MASSGSFQTNEVLWCYVTFNWSVASQDIQNNRTTINWNVVYHQDKDISISADYFNVDIEGQRVLSITDETLISGREFGSGSLTLNHNEDGTKSFSVSMEGRGELSFVAGNVSGTQTFALDTIPRASVISSASAVTIGEACSIRWTPASSGYKYKIRFNLGTWVYTTDFISPNTTGAYTYTGYRIPLEVAEQLPNSKTGTMTAYLWTFDSGGTQIGTSSSATFTATVPSSLGPNAVMNVSARNTLALYSLDDIYIQGRSKAVVDFTGSAAQYGASIASCSFILLGTKYTSGGATAIVSNYVSSSGNIDITGTVTDSRGYSTTLKETINVYAYTAPMVVPYSGEQIVVQRENKTQLRIEAGKKFSSLGGNNFCSLSYRYAKSGTSLPSTWTEILSADSSSDKVSFLAAGVTLDEKSSYTVELKAEDELGEQGIISFAVSTGEITFHLKKGGKGAAFGKYAEEDNLLDVAWPAKFQGGINGIYFKASDVTDPFNITVSGLEQTIFVFGRETAASIYYDGEGKLIVGGTNQFACSISQNVITVSGFNGSRFGFISDRPFDIQ